MPRLESAPGISPRLGLQGRLNLMIGLVMLILVSSGLLYAVHEARRTVREEAQSTMRLAQQLLEVGFPDESSEGAPVVTWMNRLGQLEKIRHLQIRVTGPHASGVDRRLSDNPPRYGVPDWFRWAVAPDQIRSEHPLEGRGQQGDRIVIETNADDEIAEVWSETRAFLLLLLTLSGAVFVLVNVIVGRALRSVDTILEGLENIEKGAFSKRLPELSTLEFNRITSAFNLMARKLEKTREENRELVHMSLQIQEEERRHLARELHDDLGQSLTAIKLMAAALRKQGEGVANEPANQIIHICDRLFLVIRSMMRRLRPPLLDELGLVASLEDLIGTWRTTHPELAINLQCSRGVDEACGDEGGIDLFRIIQECLTNTTKHARAEQLSIKITLERTAHENRIHLEIEDDGVGFDVNQPQKGFGLKSIRERVEGLNGELQLESPPGRGVVIRVTLPGQPDHE